MDRSSSRRGAPRRIGPGRRAALSLAVAAGALAAIELVARALAPPAPDFRGGEACVRFDPVHRYTFAPGCRVSACGDLRGGTQFEDAWTTSEGYLVSEFPSVAGSGTAAGEVTVVLGDSVSAHRACCSYAARLAAGGRTVVNASIQGAASIYGRRLWERDLVPQHGGEIDRLVIAYLWNDLTSVEQCALDPGPAPVGRRLRLWLDRSAAVRWVRTRRALALGPVPVSLMPYGTAWDDYEELTRCYDRNLRALIASARARGIDVVLVAMPSLFDVLPVEGATLDRWREYVSHDGPYPLAIVPLDRRAVVAAALEAGRGAAGTPPGSDPVALGPTTLDLDAALAHLDRDPALAPLYRAVLEAFRDRIEAFRARLARVAREEHVPFVDLAATFRREAAGWGPDRVRAELFPVDVLHFDCAGHAWAAAELTRLVGPVAGPGVGGDVAGREQRP